MEHGHFPFSIVMGNYILDISETTDIKDIAARLIIILEHGLFPKLTVRCCMTLSQKLCTQLAYLSHFWSGQLTCKNVHEQLQV